MFSALIGATSAIAIEHTLQEIPALQVKHVHSAEACDQKNRGLPLEYYYFDQDACACFFNRELDDTEDFPKLINQIFTT